MKIGYQDLQEGTSYVDCPPTIIGITLSIFLFVFCVPTPGSWEEAVRAKVLVREVRKRGRA